jgi:hypothetical protein
MSYALGGNSELFIKKALDTLILAAAIAIGVIASAVLMKLILKVAQTVKEKSREIKTKKEQSHD